MRTLQELIHLFPNKTGRELLEIQAQDRIKDALAFKKENEIKLKWIDDINSNGGYFRGRYKTQMFYYNLTNAVLDDYGEIYVDVYGIKVFLGTEKAFVDDSELHIEKTFRSYQHISFFSFDDYEKVSIKEWNDIIFYIQGIEKFWSDYKKK